jgi:hypothetical protein
MVAGHNNKKCLTDLKYNATREDIIKIVTTKKLMKSEIDKLKSIEKSTGVSNPAIDTKRIAYNNFDNLILPSIYNAAGGYETQSSYYKNAAGDSNELLKDISDTIEEISALAKYEDGSTLSKSINALYNTYKDYESFTPPTEEEIEKEQEEIAKNVQMDDGEEQASNDDKNPLKNLDGYKQLEEWLKNIKQTTTKKKKFSQMTKLSDMQKVSPIEFIKPRPLLMKKMINNEFYCKSNAASNRFMHSIIDCSPSMSRYNEWRNLLVNRMYEDCVKLDIKFENTFWDTHLHTNGKYGVQKIVTKLDLKSKLTDIMPNGNGTNMGRSTIEKLRDIKKTKTRQYLLVMSDGDGAIENEGKEIYSLCESKNVEIKFALFSDDSTMNDIRKEDIFLVYQDYNNTGSSALKDFLSMINKT